MLILVQTGGSVRTTGFAVFAIDLVVRPFGFIFLACGLKGVIIIIERLQARIRRSA